MVFFPTHIVTNFHEPHKQLISMSISSSHPVKSKYRQNLYDLFSSHPASVGESYFEHQRMALAFAATLFLTAMAAVIHAIVPALCQNTARNRIAMLHERLEARSSTDSD